VYFSNPCQPLACVAHVEQELSIKAHRHSLRMSARVYGRPSGPAQAQDRHSLRMYARVYGSGSALSNVASSVLRLDSDQTLLTGNLFVFLRDSPDQF
jgi:hypothetical protein